VSPVSEMDDPGMKWVHSVSNSVLLLHKNKISWMPCFKQLSNPTGLYHARVETSVICFIRTSDSDNNTDTQQHCILVL
jgi:hypothetical protein